MDLPSVNEEWGDISIKDCFGSVEIKWNADETDKRRFAYLICRKLAQGGWLNVHNKPSLAASLLTRTACVSFSLEGASSYRFRNRQLFEHSNLYCDMCKISCSCPEAMEQHKSGKAHNKRMKALRMEGTTNKVILNNLKQALQSFDYCFQFERVGDLFQCECKIWAVNDECHFQSFSTKQLHSSKKKAEEECCGMVLDFYQYQSKDPENAHCIF